MVSLSYTLLVYLLIICLLHRSSFVYLWYIPNRFRSIKVKMQFDLCYFVYWQPL